MKNLVKSTIALTASNILTRLFGMLFFVILARSLDVHDYGLFRYLLTISMLYGIAFSGIPTAMTRYISSNMRDKRVIYNAASMMIALFAAVSIIILLFEQNPVLVILFLLAFMIDAFYIGFVRGIFNIVKLSGFKLVENIIQLIILVLSYIVYKRIDFMFAVIFYCISGVIAILIMESFRPELRLRLRLDMSYVKRITRYSVFVLFGAIGWSVLFGINAIFLKKYFGTEAVAFFSVAETLVQVFTFLPSAITTLMMPKISSLKDKSRLRKPLNAALMASAIISFILLILLIWFKEELIYLIFGPQYLISASIIVPLSIGFIFITMHQILTAVFQGIGKPGIASFSTVLAAIMNIALSFVLTRKLGLLGAAISNAASCLVALLFISIYYNKERKNW